MNRHVEALVARLMSRRDRIVVERATRIHPLASVRVLHGGSIAVGRQCHIHRGAILATYGGKIEIGDHCTINPYSILYGHGGLHIGNFVRIATHCVIVPANHGFDTLDVPIARQPIAALGIKIEDDVWIGANSVILDGITIGRGAVIGAGSVVTKNIPSLSIAVGNPARVISSRLERAVAVGER